MSSKSWHYLLANNYAYPTKSPIYPEDKEYLASVIDGIMNVVSIIITISVSLYISIVQPLMYMCTGFDPIFFNDNLVLQFGLFLWGCSVVILTIMWHRVGDE